jgi:hypothetical protein
MISIRYIIKYMFILKAAADGWRVKYMGENKFEFFKSKGKTQKLMSCNEFVLEYMPSIIHNSL